MGKKSILIVLCFAIFIGTFYFYFSGNRREIEKGPVLQPEAVVRVGDQLLNIAVADTGEERLRGLSGQTTLKPLHGLLFIFDESGDHGIWMKDMLFAIDVIWIDENLTVVGISENLTPESFPGVFKPPHPVTYALETEAGFAREHGITVGDIVRIEL